MGVAIILFLGISAVYCKRYKSMTDFYRVQNAELDRQLEQIHLAQKVKAQHGNKHSRA